MNAQKRLYVFFSYFSFRCWRKKLNLDVWDSLTYGQDTIWQVLYLWCHRNELNELHGNDHPRCCNFYRQLWKEPGESPSRPFQNKWDHWCLFISHLCYENHTVNSMQTHRVSPEWICSCYAAYFRPVASLNESSSWWNTRVNEMWKAERAAEVLQKQL